MKAKQKETMTKEELIDSYDYLANSASAQDCTGLMPTPATTKAERESYQAVRHYIQEGITKKEP